MEGVKTSYLYLFLFFFRAQLVRPVEQMALPPCGHEWPWQNEKDSLNGAHADVSTILIRTIVP